MAMQLVATNWYSCGTPPGGQYSLTQGGTCNISSMNINNADDTVFVLSGYTRDADDFSNTIDGVVIVEGTLNVDNSGIQINSAGRLIVRSGGAIVATNGNAFITNNGVLFVASGATLSTGGGSGGDLTINSSGTAQIDGIINARDFILNGAITGTGTINVTNSISGTGTINGQSGPFSSPIDLSSIGITWDGSVWSPSNPASPNDLLIFDGDYSTGTDGDIEAKNVIINASHTVIVSANAVFQVSAEIQNNGTLDVENNASLLSEIFSGSGNVVLNRSFSRKGWHHMNFPVLTGTFGDLDTAGFTITYSGNKTNIYNWDASTSGYTFTSSGGSLANNPFAIFIDDLGASISLTVPMSALNYQNQAQTLGYNDPGVSNPGNSQGWTDAANADGWNFLMNYYQTYVDWEKVAARLNTTTEFVSSAISIWDGSQYQTFNTGGSGSARWVSPNQSFWLRTRSTVSTSFSLIDLDKASAPFGGSTNYFKTGKNVVFHLTGDGYQVQTEVVEQPTSTIGVDPQFDATYSYPINNAPVFNTVGADSMTYSLNQQPVLDEHQHL